MKTALKEETQPEAPKSRRRDWSGEDGIIRLLSAREATAGEQSIYVAYRPQTWE